jgi:hypothetical protein
LGITIDKMKLAEILLQVTMALRVIMLKAIVLR